MSQNRPKMQAINLPQYAGNAQVSNRGIVAGFVGAVNDTVLLWDVANQVVVSPMPTANSFTIVNDANLGTSVLIILPGIYTLTLSLTVNVTGTPTIVAGINVGGAGLTADPTYTTCVAVGRVVIITADDQATMSLTATVNVVSPGQTIPVRFQASNGAGGAPAATSLLIANCSYAISRVDLAD